MTNSSQIPAVNWPTESGEYRVVQLDLDSKTYLRFANDTHESHYEVLRDILSMVGIEYESVKSKRSTWDVAAPEGPRHKVHGMGIAEVYLNNKQATFHGNSHDIDLPPARKR